MGTALFDLNQYGSDVKPLPTHEKTLLNFERDRGAAVGVARFAGGYRHAVRARSGLAGIDPVVKGYRAIRSGGTAQVGCRPIGGCDRAADRCAG